MTREQALKVSALLFKIESLETLHDEILGLESLADVGDIDFQEKLLNLIIDKLDKTKKELEEL